MTTGGEGLKHLAAAIAATLDYADTTVHSLV
jgi:hypothetical protein